MASSSPAPSKRRAYSTSSQVVISSSSRSGSRPGTVARRAVVGQVRGRPDPDERLDERLAVERRGRPPRPRGRVTASSSAVAGPPRRTRGGRRRRTAASPSRRSAGGPDRPRPRPGTAARARARSTDRRAPKPAVASRIAALSRTLTVSACSTATPDRTSPAGAHEFRPRVGFSPKRPQHDEGIRIEPAPSLPWAAGTIPRQPRPPSRRTSRRSSGRGPRDCGPDRRAPARTSSGCRTRASSSCPSTIRPGGPLPPAKLGVLAETCSRNAREPFVWGSPGQGRAEVLEQERHAGQGRPRARLLERCDAAGGRASNIGRRPR